MSNCNPALSDGGTASQPVVAGFVARHGSLASSGVAGGGMASQPVTACSFLSLLELLPVFWGASWSPSSS